LPLASLPSGFPRNPNVLLIRTHPNPSPSVANKNIFNSLTEKQIKTKTVGLKQKTIKTGTPADCQQLKWTSVGSLCGLQ
jgi:hypothetical protein